MKIGTDGVLLGAWTPNPNGKNILDIGTGTGLIALMLAQRFPQAQITALEIDFDAFEESSRNFEESPFKTRIKGIHSAVQNYQPDFQFDLIVSNPPFFEWTHKADTARNKARQHSELNYSELLAHSARLLSDDGKIALIFPYLAEAEILDLAEKLNLFPEKITHIKGNPQADFKRTLLLLSRSKSESIEDELTIEIDRNVYTPEYIELTQAFYLKM